MPSESVNPYSYDTPAYVDSPPEMFEPAPEGYGGVVFPYRGVEPHGVDPRSSLPDNEEDDAGGKVVVNIQEPVDEPAPVPVRIVSESPSEYSDWRAYQMVVSASPTSIANRKEGRKKLTIFNLSPTVTLWVGPSSSLSPWSGYPVRPNTDLDLSCEAEVWGISDDGNPLSVAVMLEFSTEYRR